MALLGIAIAIASVVVRLIGDLGWVTSVGDWTGTVLTVLVAAAGLFGLEALGVLKTISSPRRRLAAELGVLAVFAGFVVWAYVVRDPQRLHLTKSLAAGETYTHKITGIGASGDLFSVVVRPEGALRVHVTVSRVQRSYEVPAGEDGVNRLERVLVGDGWTVRVAAIDGTAGNFDLDIEASESETLSLGSTINGSLPVPAASDGYLVDLPTAGPLRITLRGTEGPSFRPSLEVLTIRNVVAMYSRPTEDGWEIFERVSAGRYVIVVHAPDRSTGGYTLTVHGSDAVPTDPGRPPPRSVPISDTVPDVYRLPYPEAQHQLAEAGFTAVAVDVCSSSVSAGHVRQVYVPDGNDEIVVVDAPGSTLRPLPEGTTTLHVKVANGSSC